MSSEPHADPLAAARACLRRDDPAGAERCLREAVERDPGCHAAYHGLGLLALRFGKLALAADLIGHAGALAPDAPAYHANHCEILRRLGRLDEAREAGERAAALDAAGADAFYNLGLVHADRQAWADAEANYRRAAALDPRHNLAINNLGAALERQGDLAGALAAYRAAVEIDPRHAEAQNNLGALLVADGKVEAARQCFEAAIEAQPAFVAAHQNVSSLKTYAADDPHLAALRALEPRAATLPERDRERFHFAYAKALEDLGEYDAAFDHYAHGNALEPAGYDPVRAEAAFERAARLFDAARLAAPAPGAPDDPTPVFIVGMPRSGTTLIEQILASHPEVHGAGELDCFDAAVAGALGLGPRGAPFDVDGDALAHLDWAAIGRDYLARVRALAPDATRITDKMPANFFYLGAIRLALPGAHIIHSARDPMDSCLSCFTRMFTDTMAFAYDLEHLGHYYAGYWTLMRHWHAVLPEGRVLDVRYESLVADLEAHARRLVAHLGLDWAPACLRFHENRRPVKTASVAQVRKPVYRSSVARWERFADHLGPLLDRVAPYR